MRIYNKDDSKKSIDGIEKMVYQKFKNIYKTNQNTYYRKVITDIIYNEKTKLVALFKDYLILDDTSEFLRRYYNMNENYNRLLKIVTFYDSYSRIFPNYIIIPESKYLYKNIRRKQKIIDAFNQIKSEEEVNRKTYGLNKLKKGVADEFFDTYLKHSICKYEPSHHASSSIHSADKITNNSISISLNLNKNIFDNEESIASIQNILNEVERKNKVQIIENTNAKEIRNGHGNINGIENGNGKNMRSLDTPTTFGEAEIASISSINTIINSKNKLKRILADNVNKLKNFPVNTLNLNNLSKNKLYSNKNSPNNLIPNNVIVIKNKNNEKTIIKKLPLKQLNLAGSGLNNDCANNFQSNTLLNSDKKISEGSLNSNSLDKKKLSSHRITPSIPEVYNTVKIINNYPNIIIPSGSTHVSINQNYYNYGDCQSPVASVTSSMGSMGPVASRIIMIEHFNSALNTGVNSGSNTGHATLHNLGLNTGFNSDRFSANNTNTNTANNTLTNNFVKFSKIDVKKKIDHDRKTSKISHKSGSPNEIKEYTSFMKDFSSPKISAAYKKCLKNSVLPNPVKSHNSKVYNHPITNSTTNTINANSIITSNITQNKITPPVETVKKNTQQIYSKVLNIFQDNKRVSNDFYKTIEHNKKLHERENSKKRRDRNNKENYKNNSKLLKVTNNIQNGKETIETNRESKSRFDIKEEYKFATEKNKIECLTARNSIEKISGYKYLNNELRSSIVNKNINSGFKGVSVNKNEGNIKYNDINNVPQANNHKKIYLSPGKKEKYKLPITNIKNKNEDKTKKKSMTKHGTPIKFDLSRTKLINSVISRPKEEISMEVNKNRVTQLKALNLKDNIKIILNANENKCKTLNNSKINSTRSGVKSIDFQTIKKRKNI